VSLDKLKQEVMDQAERQAKTVLDGAHSEEQRILSEAKTEAKRIISEAAEKTGAEASEMALELRAAAMLQAKRIESEAKERLVQGVLDEIKSELVQIAKAGRYPDIFDSLARQAIRGLGDKEFVLKTNSRDRKLGEKHGRVAGTIDAIGGVIVAKTDGTIQINNTFEALLEQHEEQLKQKAFEQLFVHGGRKAHASKPAGQKAAKKTKAKAKGSGKGKKKR